MKKNKYILIKTLHSLKKQTNVKKKHIMFFLMKKKNVLIEPLHSLRNYNRLTEKETKKKC